MKAVKTKLLTMLMAAVMVFAMAPLSLGTVYADDAEMYNLWVGETQVGPDSLSDPSGTWSYSGDKAKGTLTLNGLNMTESIEADGIDLTIKLVGNNTIGSNDGQPAIDVDYAYPYVDPDVNDTGDYDKGLLTIEGSGTLNAIGGTCAIYVADGLTINSGTVNATAEEITSEMAPSAIAVNGSIKITGGTVNATANDEYLNAISSYGWDESNGIIITGGEVTAKTTHENGENAIYSYNGDIDISGANTVVVATTNSYNPAIVTNEGEEPGGLGDAISISGGADVTASCADPDNGGSIEVWSEGDTGKITISDAKVQTQVSGIGVRDGEITIKDSQVTANGMIGLDAKTITISNSGSGKYATRVEANSVVPEDWIDFKPTELQSMEDGTGFPAICATAALNLNDVKVVEPAGGTVKSVKTYFYKDEVMTVCDGDKIAEHVVIEAEKKVDPTPDPNNKQKVAVVPFMAKMTAKGKKTLKLKWAAVSGAEGYDITLQHCGKKKDTIKKTVTTTSWTKTGLKAKRAYKAKVKAWAMINGQKTYIGKSQTVHCYTSGGKGKYTNPKAVKVNKKQVTLKVGKKFQIDATVKKVKKGKKLMPVLHGTNVRYMSNDKTIATVSKKGKIKAKAPGECTIYVYAANGASKAIKVTVK